MFKPTLYALVLGVLIFASCGSSDEEVEPLPAGILDKDSLAFYMAQVHIIDAASRNREVRKQGLEIEAKHAFVTYFDTAGVNEKKFKKSLDYWRTDFEAMEYIYDHAMEILSTKLAKLNSAASEESKEEDEPVTPKTLIQAKKEELLKHR